MGLPLLLNMFVLCAYVYDVDSRCEVILVESNTVESSNSTVIKKPVNRCLPFCSPGTHFEKGMLVRILECLFGPVPPCMQNIHCIWGIY